jgi:2-polyprenyl-3-methyl-5-hydroxy-6-metoxy-1,4-benzoquinol methylase
MILLDLFFNPEVSKTSKGVLELLIIAVPVIIAAASFAFNVRKNYLEFFHKKQVLEEDRITDRRKEIGLKLNEFYGPFLQNSKKSTTLYRALTKHRNNFRLLDYLLDPNLFSALSNNEMVLVKEIIDIGIKQQELIADKGGLIDDPILCNFYIDLNVSNQFPFERRDLHNIGLIPRANAHYRILELAYKGELSGEIDKFEDYRFPRELPQEIERRIYELQKELKTLRSFLNKPKDMIKEYLNKTIKSYDDNAEEYAKNVANLNSRYIVDFINNLKHNFPNLSNSNISILDIGCGSGRDLEQFSSQGFKVKGIDKSKKLLKIASNKVDKKHLQYLDILNIHNLKGKFHGVWLNASLVHIPKINVPDVLSSIVGKLHENGIIYISVKEGYGEGLEEDNRYSGAEKYWSYFTEFEMKNMLENTGVKIILSKVDKTSSSYATHPWINLIGML